MYKTYYTYMLTSKKNTALYTGVTNDLVRRVREHKEGKIPGYTQKYCCSKLVYFEEYSDINQAIAREKQIKGFRREKKNELINSKNPEWKELIIDE